MNNSRAVTHYPVKVFEGGCVAMYLIFKDHKSVPHFPQELKTDGF
jgi:hypothetical protein